MNSLKEPIQWINERPYRHGILLDYIEVISELKTLQENYRKLQGEKMVLIRDNVRMAVSFPLEEIAWLTSLCDVSSIGNGKFQAVTRCDAAKSGNAVGEGKTVFAAVMACHEDKRRHNSSAGV